MKYLNKSMSLKLIACSTIVLNFSLWGLQTHAQSSNSGDTTILISEVPQTGSWGYPTERGSWSRQLGLTEKQMEQLVELKSDYTVRTAQQKAELMASKKKMMLLMTEPKVDKEAVRALNERIKSLQSDLSDSRVNNMLNAMEIMTPKQREEIHHHMLVHEVAHHHHQSFGNKYHKDSEHHTA